MDALLDEALKAVFVAVAGSLGTLLVAILVKLLQRVGLSVSAEQQAKIEKLAQEAILAAEEWARAEIKAGSLKMPSTAKLVQATEDLMAKVPSLTAEDADAVIHAQIAKLRVAAGGALLRTPVGM